MDFNKLIEKEIESRVEARCIEYKKELIIDVSFFPF